MNNVYFINSYEERIKIGECSSYENGCKIIDNFLSEKNYKSFYKRNWEVSEGLMFDVGSHTEFFLIEGMKIND